MARVMLSEQTADRIKQLIDRQYKPGDKIPAEMELAEFMGVSRTTVREAVKSLCSRNIIEIRRGQGTYVRENPGMPDDPLGSKDMDEEQLKNDTFEMSELLEPELVKLAARKASEESILRMNKIRSSEAELLRRYRRGDYIHLKDFRKLDLDFHRAVIDGAGNQIISRSLPMFIASCTEWYSVWTDLDINRVLDSFDKYHALILKAVEEHNGEDAYRYSKEHTQDIISIYRDKSR